LLKEWARSGITSVDVICPGFSADCLETLEEINIENRNLFIQTGGKNYRYIPALNDSRYHIEALVELILKHTGGWPELVPKFAAADRTAEREASRERALAMGAEH
jgi:ferrochelatase